MSQNSHGTGRMSQSQQSQQSQSHRAAYGDEPSNSQQSNPPPQIYSVRITSPPCLALTNLCRQAVYSGVDVYEMEINGVAVMRRRNDSWLNATQILKVAGVEKGKRTKVLEKEILIGDHEKVQGGYGKYQGTWIKFERGLTFCRQYGVEGLLQPLLTYDMGQDGGVAGQGGLDTPTKEQAMAAQRKRLYSSSQENKSTGQSTTFFKNISNSAAQAVAAISKARFDSPGPRSRNSLNRPPSFSRQSSQQHLDSQENRFPGGSQQSMASFTSENSFGQQDSAYATQLPQFSHAGNSEFHEPPRKRMRTALPSGPGEAFDMSMQSEREQTPTEPNESFMYRQNPDEDSPMSLAPLPMQHTPAAEAKRALLVSLFTDPSRNDFSTHEAFTTMSGEEFDVPVDASGHTVLHWAATLARMNLLRALIAKGASIYRVNGGGETALMRACAVTNSLDTNNFTDLLELLGPTIELKDCRGRTVLHHIAVTSAVKGRSAASKYYLEALLEFVVRSGSAPNSQQSFSGAPAPKFMGIGRFISEIVNAQDKSGDTALNIAARVGNRSIISQLMEVGADAALPNRAGLCPLDFGVGDPAEVSEGRRGPFGSPDKTLAGKSAKECQKDIISCKYIISPLPDQF